MSRYAPVQIHQNTKEPSISSDFSRSTGSYASSSSSTPRSLSPSDFPARDATFGSRVIHSGNNTVVLHDKVVYDDYAPHVSDFTPPHPSRRT